MTERGRIIAAMVLTYMLFGILLNSVGTVILQSIATLGQTKQSAAVLEAFKDLPIAITSFLVASFLPRLGYRRAMILGTGAVALTCLLMPLIPTFAVAKLLFAVSGVALRTGRAGDRHLAANFQQRSAPLASGDERAGRLDLRRRAGSRPTGGGRGVAPDRLVSARQSLHPCRCRIDIDQSTAGPRYHARSTSKLGQRTPCCIHPAGPWSLSRPYLSRH